MWQAHLARVFTGRRPGPLFQTVEATSLELPQANSDTRQISIKPILAAHSCRIVRNCVDYNGDSSVAIFANAGTGHY